MYTNLEIFLANFSFLILFISMLVYWIQASNSVLPATTNNPVKKSFPIGTIGMLMSNASLFLLLVLRWKESGHFPLSNLYESLMFLSWSLTLIHLFIEIGFSSEFSFENGAKSALVFDQRKALIGKLIGSITAPCALFTNAFATFSLPKEMQEAAPLVPALQSNWLMMHVTVMILSYAALILGSLLSIGFLVITGGKNVSLSSEAESMGQSTTLSSIQTQPLGFNLNGGSGLGGSQVSSATFSSLNNASPGAVALRTSDGFSSVTGPNQLENSTASDNTKSARSANTQKNSRLNLARTLDNLSYRVLGLGFPLLTIGILSGAVWANEAWGSYWSWDPKETWALLTWLVFAIYLHTRLTKGWEGRKPALIATLGFVTVWVCFLGVNLIGEGLHSYGWLGQS
jgi:cytochrome c-type biogenesis protein CcsB